VAFSTRESKSWSLTRGTGWVRSRDSPKSWSLIRRVLKPFTYQKGISAFFLFYNLKVRFAFAIIYTHILIGLREQGRFKYEQKEKKEKEKEKERFFKPD